MESRQLYRLLLATVLLIGSVGCTKSETRTKRLLKQGRWMFTELEIGSNSNSLLPKWDIKEEPLEKDFAQATWTHYDGSSCKFLWRFDYYSGTFSFQIDDSVSQDDSAKAFIQCSNLSGSYFILNDKRNLFEFESFETQGYPGIRVYIKMEPI